MEGCDWERSFSLVIAVSWAAVVIVVWWSAVAQIAVAFSWATVAWQMELLEPTSVASLLLLEIETLLVVEFVVVVDAGINLPLLLLLGAAVAVWHDPLAFW